MKQKHPFFFRFAGEIKRAKRASERKYHWLSETREQQLVSRVFQRCVMSEQNPDASLDLRTRCRNYWVEWSVKRCIPTGSSVSTLPVELECCQSQCWAGSFNSHLVRCYVSGLLNGLLSRRAPWRISLSLSLSLSRARARALILKYPLPSPSSIFFLAESVSSLFNSDFLSPEHNARAIHGEWLIF